MERSGRKRGDFQVSCPLFVVTGNDDAELAANAVGTRKQIAFYASTPAYRKVLDLHGWGDLQTDLHRLSHAGEWDAMGSLIDDEILNEFAVVAPVARCREEGSRALRRRHRPGPGRLPRVGRRGHRRRRCARDEEPRREYPIMDEAAKVFADPKAYTDEPDIACGAGPSTGQRTRFVGRGAGLPSVLGDHQARRHHGHRTGEHAVHQFAAPGSGDSGGRRPSGRHRGQHADPHGRSATPRRTGDRRRLVPAKGHAGDEGSHRRTGQGLRRQDGRRWVRSATSSRRSPSTTRCT